MKKMLSLLASISVALSAVSATASAQEYEQFSSDLPMADESIKELSDGIKDGRYFADFDGNGVFDPIDARLVLKYYGCASSLGKDSSIDDIDWSDKTDGFIFDECFQGAFLNSYETFELHGETFVSVPLNNEMLENVKKYGDVDGDGVINARDSAELLCVYYNGFELGDVNADNSVNASDASYVLSYYSSNSTGQAVDSYTEQAMEILADVNGDGEINASDATEILSAYSDLSIAE